MSKHGGSESSGLVQPIGLAALRPVNDGGVIIEPPEAVQARKDAGERRERALHFERRRLALGILSGAQEATVDSALSVADELIAKTGGVV
jgi:hypothetical protein